MITLAIECATKVASAALCADEEVMGEIYLGADVHHSEVLLSAIERLLSFTGMNVQDIDLLACTTGPGSFTGVRIGVATVKGLALASGKPIVGVSTLEALAMNVSFSSRLICPLLDARKDQVYAGLYRIGEDGLPVAMVPDYLGDIESVLKTLSSEEVDFIGDGVLKYQEDIRRQVPGAKISGNMKINNPVASATGIVALGRYRQGGRTNDSLSLLPVYLRLSEAEQKNRS